MSDILIQRLDNLWTMLEEEGYYTKANTVSLARDHIRGLLNKLKETESRLSKAMLIIERYGEDEGYIPQSVAHLYEELEAAAEQRGYANAMEAERKLTDQICAEWAETSQRNYQRAKHYFAALEKIAQTQYGLQSIMEDYPDTDSPEYLKAVLEYYAHLVNSYQKIAREAIKDAEN